jgi:hypothetical protein
LDIRRYLQNPERMAEDGGRDILGSGKGGEWQVHAVEILVRAPEHKRCPQKLGWNVPALYRSSLFLECRELYAKIIGRPSINIAIPGFKEVP